MQFFAADQVADPEILRRLSKEVNRQLLARKNLTWTGSASSEKS